MERYFQQRQRFSIGIFLMCIINLIFSYYFAVFISSWPFDSVLIGSAIKAIVIFVLFWVIFYVQAKISPPMYGDYIILFWVIVFFTIYFYPIYLEIQNPVFDVNNYQFSFFPGVGSSSGLFFYILYRAYQFVVLGIAVAIGIFLGYDNAYKKAYKVDTILYSPQHGKFYKKVYSRKYNIFKEDYLSTMVSKVDFKVLLQFLSDQQRFKDLPNVKKQEFSVFSIPEDDKKIIKIQNISYILTKDESLYLSKILQV